jgi:hypothetical protein
LGFTYSMAQPHSRSGLQVYTGLSRTLILVFQSYGWLDRICILGFKFIMARIFHSHHLPGIHNTSGLSRIFPLGFKGTMARPQQYYGFHCRHGSVDATISWGSSLQWLRTIFLGFIFKLALAALNFWVSILLWLGKTHISFGVQCHTGCPHLDLGLQLHTGSNLSSGLQSSIGS